MNPTASFTYSFFRGPGVTRQAYDAMSADGYHAKIEQRLASERLWSAHDDDYRLSVVNNGVGSRSGFADSPDLAAVDCEKAAVILRRSEARI